MSGAGRGRVGGIFVTRVFADVNGCPRSQRVALNRRRDGASVMHVAHGARPLGAVRRRDAAGSSWRGSSHTVLVSAPSVILTAKLPRSGLLPEAAPHLLGESINSPLVGRARLARVVSRCKQYVINSHVDGDGMQADVVL